MIPGPFEYHSPTSLAEAIDLLGQYGDEAKLLAGGHSLIPLMKLRLAQPAHLVDLNSVPGLDYIHEEQGHLRIGALTREVDVEYNALILDRYPLIADTARVVGDPLVRNMATLGGNLAHGDPANDHPATMLALRATVAIQGPNGERVEPVDDLFVGLLTTILEPDEILTEIRIPVPPPRSSGTYIKLERKVGDYAIAAVAVQITLSPDNSVVQAGIGLTAVGLTPIRAAAAERFLIGKQLDKAVLQEAGERAAAAADPSIDLRGSAEYKRAMVAELTQRALMKAAARVMSNGS
ncbi:MAG: xanthine dehydrogenase family protein subunit M [Chloroflexales bacterium]|nr:xanthine dehydrogenase family protein subunit M [Chloroflexales bacterium]